MSISSRPIGVFDSGIGGLSVLKHLLLSLPNERFVYLGDTARVPYGNKSAETVRTYARQCAAFLLRHDVRAIVVACNTVSAVALDVLRDECPVPVIGVIEPAAREAVAATRNSHIGVIGTRATISSNSYTKAITRLASERAVMVHAQPCPLFVPLVEEGWLESPVTRLVADEYLRPLVANGIDTLVLGCTHYPLLTPMLSSMLPNVALIDCGACTTAETAKILGIQMESTSMQAAASRTLFYVTDASPNFSLLARQFLGIVVNDPVTVDIDQMRTSS